MTFKIGKHIKIYFQEEKNGKKEWSSYIKKKYR